MLALHHESELKGLSLGERTLLAQAIARGQEAGPWLAESLDRGHTPTEEDSARLAAAADRLVAEFGED